MLMQNIYNLLTAIILQLLSPHSSISIAKLHLLSIRSNKENFKNEMSFDQTTKFILIAESIDLFDSKFFELQLMCSVI